MKISLDTETTGSNFYYGCKPFYVSTCTDNGVVRSWQWEVDLYTRNVEVPDNELENLIEYLYSAEEIWLHNSKFDISALSTIGVEWCPELWSKTHDTLVLSHLVDSLMQHGLKALAKMLMYVTDDDEAELAKIVTIARRKATSYNAKNGPYLIDIARANHPKFPGTKKPKRKGKEDEGGWWCLDMWLPRAMKLTLDYGDDSWLTICSKYADMDAIRTMKLAEILLEALVELNIPYQLYLNRLRMLLVTFDMEQYGVPLRKNTLKFKTKALLAAKQSVYKKIDGDKVNPNSPKQLQKLLFDEFGLPVLEVTKPKKKKDGTYSVGGTPSTKEEILTQLELIATGRASAYLQDLLKYKKIQSAVTYTTAYSENVCPIHRLRSRYNITGTQTTRFSASLTQNIGKREDMNLRDLFGPDEGKFWISADFVNIELIVAATIAEEDLMLDVFKRGESYHILIASAVYPEELEQLGESGFKKSNLYRRVKSGNYAIQYGAQEEKADWTYGKPGAYKAIRSKFYKLFNLSDSKLEEAKETGRVKTISGYPLVCPRTRGRIEPTKPFSYWCQGSVGDIIAEAMFNIFNNTWYQMVLQVHDELVFEIPYDKCHPDNWRVIGEKIQEEMQAAALAFGIQVPVAVSLHKTSWRTEDDVIEGKFLS